MCLGYRCFQCDGRRCVSVPIRSLHGKRPWRLDSIKMVRPMRWKTSAGQWTFHSSRFHLIDRAPLALVSNFQDELFKTAFSSTNRPAYDYSGNGWTPSMQTKTWGWDAPRRSLNLPRTGKEHWHVLCKTFCIILFGCCLLSFIFKDDGCGLNHPYVELVYSVGRNIRWQRSNSEVLASTKDWDQELSALRGMERVIIYLGCE